MPNPAGIQSVGIRNVYPQSYGATLGQSTSAPSPYSGANAQNPKAAEGSNQANVSPEVQRAMATALLGKPLPFWLLLIVLTIALGWGVKKLPGVSEKEDFKDLRVSFYNILIVSFMAIIGITFWKIVFTRFPVPGLTSLVNAI